MLIFLNNGVPYKEPNPTWEQILEDQILYINKGYYLLSSIENIFLKRLVLHQCGQVMFSSRRQFTSNIILNMVNKTMDTTLFMPLLKPP